MTRPTLSTAMEATWPPAQTRRLGPWTIRDGQGGGKRVSAATAEAGVGRQDIDHAEAAMRILNQPRLFMICEGDEKLDAQLDARGYAIIDPVVLYSVAVSDLTTKPIPPVSAFTIWQPLAIMADIWGAGGIGAARLAVMHRAKGPKTGVLARHADQPAGAAFVAIHENTAMIHAIEVAPAHRRKGVGANILRAAAHWAQDQGAANLGLAVTRANAGANTLYASLGMTVVGHYHYRIK